jgi:hypothetical protein
VITLDQYFGIYANHPDAGPGMYAAAERMLDTVNPLLAKAASEGVKLETNPNTNSLVSGETNGGFRPQACPVGASKSSHKQARAVDVFDPKNALDDWITDEILTQFGLYREHPDDTPHWCHLSDKAPGSGRRTFKP